MQRLNFHETLRAYCTTLKLCTFKGTRFFFLWWHIIPLTYLFQIIFLVFFRTISFFLVKKNLPIIFTKTPLTPIGFSIKPVEISHFFLTSYLSKICYWLGLCNIPIRFFYSAFHPEKNLKSISTFLILDKLP